jgi:hypothetical protein
VLWRKHAPEKYKLGRSISAWAFSSAEKWSTAHARGIITDAQINGAKPVFAAMRVFHAWIGDQDRKLDHVAFDLNSSDAEAGVAFYDHAEGMSYAWRNPDEPVSVLPASQLDFGLLEVIAYAVDQIAMMQEAEIRRLVGRIPDLYLPEPHRAIILANLLARRQKLRVAFGV